MQLGSNPAPAASSSECMPIEYLAREYGPRASWVGLTR